VKRWPTWEKILFGAFLFWSGAGLIFTLGRFTPEAVGAWPVPGWLRDFVDGCLRTGDFLLILLAFANTHVHAARQWGPALARRWALIVLVVALAIETLGVATGFPFGPYYYTDRFGPMLGVVPLTIPLAWQVVVTNALFLARGLVRNRSRLGEAALSGAICTAYDFILEPFATREAILDLARRGGSPGELPGMVRRQRAAGLRFRAPGPHAISPRFPACADSGRDPADFPGGGICLVSGQGTGIPAP
jgi:hypothetical protein